MLTKRDLGQIGQLLDQKLEEKLEQKLEEKLESKLEQKLAPIRKDIKKIKKDLTTTISFFDHEVTTLNSRMDRVESHLHLPPLA